jgi:hypothetical protein
MATQPKQEPREALELDAYYNAKAYILEADLRQPVASDIKPQALVELPRDGKYTFKEVGPFRLAGVLSYRYGYTQVAGHPSSKGHGLNTLATSVVEDINVLDVVTADRVVGQISTDYPGNGKDEVQVPRVTFLGTRFVNLRIGGHKVDIDQDIHILGPKPRNDRSYFEDAGSLTRMTRQFAHIRKMKKLPDWAAGEFARDKNATQREDVAQMSLVNSVNGAPGATFGHVIDVPHFGRIYLGELTIDRKLEDGSDDYYLYTFKLRMIRLDMGCIGSGSSTIVAMDANGKGGKGGTG